MVRNEEERRGGRERKGEGRRKREKEEERRNEREGRKEGMKEGREEGREVKKLVTSVGGVYRYSYEAAHKLSAVKQINH